MAVVGTHALKPFTLPVAPQPVAAQARNNDNLMRTAFNLHDADASIHNQSGLLSARPATAAIGAVYYATDSGSESISIYTSTGWVTIINAGSSLTGSGTAGNIAKWSSATGLTDSLLSESGSTVSMTGDFSATNGLFDTLDVSTVSSFGGFAAFSDDVYVAGELTVDGNTTLGSSNADTINVIGRFSSNLEPRTDDTYDIGRTGHRWRDLLLSGDADIDGALDVAVSVTSPSFVGDLTGNASTVTNGVYTTGSYADPSWITSLAWAKLTGVPTTLGDVFGPASATDDAIVRFDGVTGKLVQNSVATITDVGSLTISNSSTLSPIVTGTTSSTATGDQLLMLIGGTRAGATYIGRMSNTGLGGLAAWEAKSWTTVMRISSNASEAFAGSFSTHPFSLVTDSVARWTVDVSGTLRPSQQLPTIDIGTSVYRVGAAYINQMFMKASTTTATAPLNIPHGAFPNSPANGDIWTTASGLFVQINGSNVGPMGDVSGPGGGTTPDGIALFDGVTGKLLKNSNIIVSGSTITASLSGNASTATALQTSRTIWGQSFNGTADVNGLLTIFRNATTVQRVANSLAPVDSRYWDTRVDTTAGQWELRSTTDGGTTVVNALRIVHATGAATFGGTLGVTGVLTASTGSTVIGAAALDGSAPVSLIIRNTTSSSAWGVNASFGRLGFWSEDGSSPGNTLRAAIDGFTPSSTGAQGGLRFWTSGASGLVQSLELAHNTGRATFYSTVTAQDDLTVDGGILTIDTDANSAITLNRVSGTQVNINWQTSGTARWLMGRSSTAESGGDTGSDFQLQARTDAGGSIDTPLTITRAAGGAATWERHNIFPAATTSIPSIRLPHGTAPTSPVDGDMWTTTAGLYVRINGTTVGPLS